jgi:hypothetical protein
VHAFLSTACFSTRHCQDDHSARHVSSVVVVDVSAIKPESYTMKVWLDIFPEIRDMLSAFVHSCFSCFFVHVVRAPVLHLHSIASAIGLSYTFARCNSIEQLRASLLSSCA